MNFKKIQELVKKKDYLFSEHADEERTKDQLTVEERLGDPRGESRLIACESMNGKLIHIAIGVRFEKPVIVTVYLPSSDEWIHGKIRKR